MLEEVGEQGNIPTHLFNPKPLQDKKKKLEMQRGERGRESESNVIKCYVISSIKFEKRDAELKRTALGSRASVLWWSYKM